MAGKIFINYRRGDDPGYTQALYQRLEGEFASGDLFMDVEGHIKPGDDFVGVLGAQVAQCDILLVVIGPRWQELLAARADDRDDFVAIEIKAALDQGKRVVPVLVGGASIPRAETLPEPIRGLVSRNAMGLRPDRFRVDCEGLVAALRESLAAAKKERAAREDAERRSAEAERQRSEAEEKARLAAQEEERARLAAQEKERARVRVSPEELAILEDTQDLRRRLRTWRRWFSVFLAIWMLICALVSIGIAKKGDYSVASGVLITFSVFALAIYGIGRLVIWIVRLFRRFARARQQVRRATPTSS